MTRLGDFWKFLVTFFHSSSPNQNGLFGLLWKASLSNKNCYGYHLCYLLSNLGSFLFSHLVTLSIAYPLAFLGVSLLTFFCFAKVDELQRPVLTENPSSRKQNDVIRHKRHFMRNSRMTIGWNLMKNSIKKEDNDDDDDVVSLCLFKLTQCKQLFVSRQWNDVSVQIWIDTLKDKAQRPPSFPFLTKSLITFSI